VRQLLVLGQRLLEQQRLGQRRKSLAQQMQLVRRQFLWSFQLEVFHFPWYQGSWWRQFL